MKCFDDDLVTICVAVALGYAAYYITLEPVAGLVALTLLYNGARLATSFVHSNENAAVIALYIHVAW